MLPNLCHDPYLFLYRIRSYLSAQKRNVHKQRAALNRNVPKEQFPFRMVHPPCWLDSKPSGFRYQWPVYALQVHPPPQFSTKDLANKLGLQWIFHPTNHKYLVDITTISEKRTHFFFRLSEPSYKSCRSKKCEDPVKRSVIIQWTKRVRFVVDVQVIWKFETWKLMQKAVDIQVGMQISLYFCLGMPSEGL